MVEDILQSELFQRWTVAIRRHLTAHTVRVANQQIEQVREELREQVLSPIGRLMGDVDALTRRTSLQATNVAASVKYIESLTEDVHELDGRVGETREQLVEVRAQLAQIAEQLAGVSDQLAALRLGADVVERSGDPH
jgi:chromosome segregation ATPase